MGNFNLDPDYVTVAERIVEFRNKYPEGSLQPWNPAAPYTIELINGNPNFVVVAAAYRTPDDTRPGIGMAYEPIPGSTPYTRGSELQNAETAAWGRAIVATLAADTNKGIATKEEITVQSERNNNPNPNQTPRGNQQNTVEVYTSWFDAIEERRNLPDAYDQLLNLYNEATAAKLPNNVLAAITAAGKQAKKA
jgi:hypothetical protein